jgi:DNA repair exonuclease SbcCD ATPase subunit
MKLSITNFQSITAGQLEFIPGINMITGTNGSGKSASFRALRAAVINPSGCNYYIQHGKDRAQVTVQNNGECVTWIRDQGSCTYVNDSTGALFAKASKLDSRDVADLGFYIDDKGKLINAPSEWEVLFPFGYSDTEMFQLFEDIFNISSSSTIIDSIKREEQELNKIIKDKRKEVEALTEQTNKTTSAVESAKPLLAEAEQLRKLIPTLAQYIGELEGDIIKYSSCAKVRAVQLPGSVPDSFTQALATLKDKLVAIDNDYKIYTQNKLKKELKTSEVYSLLSIDYHIDITAVDSIIKDCKEYISCRQKLYTANEEIARIKEQARSTKEELETFIRCPLCGGEL